MKGHMDRPLSQLPAALRIELSMRPQLKQVFEALPRDEQERYAEYVLEPHYPDTDAARAKQALRMLEARATSASVQSTRARRFRPSASGHKKLAVGFWIKP